MGGDRSAPAPRRVLVHKVARQLDVERAVVAGAAVERRVQVLEGRLQVVEYEGLADDLRERAAGGVDVVARGVVQPAAVPLAQPGSPRDQNDRDPLGVRPAEGRRAGERAHPERHGRGAQAALARVPVGGVDGGLLAG